MALDFHPQVDREIEKIQLHYRKISDNLADAFKFELLEELDRIEATPRRCAIRRDQIRRSNLPKFPYNILFRIDQESVRILAVRHHRRKPGYGMKRR